MNRKNAIKGHLLSTAAPAHILGLPEAPSGSVTKTGGDDTGESAKSIG